MRNILPIAAVLLAAAPVQAQDTSLAARIRRVENGLTMPIVVAGRTDQAFPLAQRMRVHNTPAISIAVINNGRIEWARAYGTRQAGESSAPDTATLFQAASISKPVAALGALLLAQRGTLSLDADVNTVLRSWKVPENEFTATEKVTLRRLISHSAGLTQHGFPGYASSAALPTSIQVLNGEAPANTRPVRVDVVPGSITRYSGGGLTVMQQMVTDVTGRPFPLFMRETVLRPLGMMHSSFDMDVAPDRAARIARAHTARGEPVAGGWHRYPEMAAAGLWTTPSDLARFLISVHRAARGEAGGAIPPALARQMLTVQKGENNGFGLGLQLNGVGTPRMWFGHNGANEGYRAMMVMFPETGRGAVVMTNSDAGAGLMEEVMRSIAREYEFPAFRATEKTAAALDAATIREVVGRYETTAEGRPVVFIVSESGGQLSAMNPEWPAPRTMYRAPAAELRFFVGESVREYVFERNEAGQVARVRATGGGREIILPRVNAGS